VLRIFLCSLGKLSPTELFALIQTSTNGKSITAFKVVSTITSLLSASPQRRDNAPSQLTECETAEATFALITF
jgi:hypothetical protein